MPCISDGERRRAMDSHNLVSRPPSREHGKAAKRYETVNQGVDSRIDQQAMMPVPAVGDQQIACIEPMFVL